MMTLTYHDDLDPLGDRVRLLVLVFLLPDPRELLDLKQWAAVTRNLMTAQRDIV